MAGAIYKRIILKLSGEAFQGSYGDGIDQQALANITEEIKKAKELGVEIGIVVGGGNILRGQRASCKDEIDRLTADYIGMLATVINGLALKEGFEKIGVYANVLTAIQIEKFIEPYAPSRALKYLEEKKIVIFVGGTGNPYFTTDTAASLRALEIGADVLLKATNVDGVYTDDPIVNKNAKRYDVLRFMDVLRRQLKVMDLTAVSLCMENRLPIVVFNFNVKGNLKKVILGKKVGTTVRG